MMDTITKEIDGLTFQIQQFPAMKALKLEARILKILSPIIDILFNMKSLDQNIDNVPITKAISGVLSNLDDNTLESIFLDMFSSTFVIISNEGIGSKPTLLEKNTFNLVFVGKIITAYKLLIEVMKENHFAFFELMGGLEKKIPGLQK